MRLNHLWRLNKKLDTQQERIEHLEALLQQKDQHYQQFKEILHHLRSSQESFFFFGCFGDKHDIKLILYLVSYSHLSFVVIITINEVYELYFYFENRFGNENICYIVYIKFI